MDATQVEVYGAFKQGAARSRLGAMSYAPHVAFWSQRGRALTSELVGGNREKLTGPECARIASRALRLLPQGARAGDLPDRLGLLPARAARAAAQRALPVHGVGAAQPGDVARARRNPRGRLGRRARDAGRAGRRDDLPSWRLEVRAAAADRPPGAVHRLGDRQAARLQTAQGRSTPSSCSSRSRARSPRSTATASSSPTSTGSRPSGSSISTARRSGAGNASLLSRTEAVDAGNRSARSDEALPVHETRSELNVDGGARRCPGQARGMSSYVSSAEERPSDGK